MKKILITILITFTLSVLGAPIVQMDFEAPILKQGKIERATLTLSKDAAQSIELQQIKGISIEETLYLYQIGPLVMTEGSNELSAEAQVIFLKVPETHSVKYKTGGSDIVFQWNNVEVRPTEASSQLIFSQFDIPSRPQILIWFLGTLLILIMWLAWFKYSKQIKYKKGLRQRKLKLRNELFEATDYQQIVRIWMNRDDYLKTFPEIVDHFKSFEKTLFKYQFKPVQTDSEKSEVCSAYQSFITNIRGGLSGI